MEIAVLVLLALASYRITRFIVIDTLIEEPRDWFFKKIETWLRNNVDQKRKRRFFYEKVHTLFSCTWCTGVWVSIAVYWIYFRDFWLIGIAAVAGLQGLIHALEPDDE